MAVTSNTVDLEADNAYCSICGFKVTCPVPQGLLMTLIFFVGGLSLPLMFFYGDADYSDDMMPPYLIGMSTVYALALLVLGGNMTVIYNTVLGVYTGIEIKVVDAAFRYASGTELSSGESVSDMDMAWAILGGIIVIVHLLPFYMSNSGILITTLAAVGLVVNTAICAYLDTSLLLQTFTSGSAFLLTSLCIIGIHCTPVSLFSQITDAIKYGGFLRCQPLALKL